MVNKIPERLNDFRAYDEDDSPIGAVTVDLPELSFLTDTVKGGGMLGESDLPVKGQLQSMAMTLHYRTIGQDAVKKFVHTYHQIDLRGAMEVYDPASNTNTIVPVRCTIKCAPKRFALGTFELGASTESEEEFEVTYIKIYIDGQEVLEVDKFNYVCKVNGQDLLDDVKQALGLS